MEVFEKLASKLCRCTYSTVASSWSASNRGFGKFWSRSQRRRRGKDYAAAGTGRNLASSATASATCSASIPG